MLSGLLQEFASRRGRQEIGGDHFRCRPANVAGDGVGQFLGSLDEQMAELADGS